jgi:hypothetical protein
VIGFAHDFTAGCLAQIEPCGANLQIVGRLYNWVKTAGRKIFDQTSFPRFSSYSIRRLRRSSEVVNQRWTQGSMNRLFIEPSLVDPLTHPPT